MSSAGSRDASDGGPATPRRPSPYEDAPRLPGWVRGGGGVALPPVELRTLVEGSWLELEVGPGPKAGFLVERAAAAPEAGLVGLEIRRKWASVGDERLAKLGFGKRARVFCEDAGLALPRLVPDASVRRAYLHFPDPWWKKRHTKRLVLGDPFLDQIARLLEDSGELFVQTDVEERAEQYERVTRAHGAFLPAGDAEGSAALAENPYGARSPREHRAIADGLPVHRFRFRRVPR